jgi:rhodanese-related sulfurtransferase
MKTLSIVKLFFLSSILFLNLNSKAQNPENWTSKQLIEPSELANEINAKTDVPIIISVGPATNIPNSIAVGIVSEKEGLKKFKEQLKNLPKDRKIVIYCGCCPFEHCPNVRPAIDVLKEMNFTNYYLLNLPNNIRKDWIDKGYPIIKL